jgi:hypothetical protein
MTVQTFFSLSTLVLCAVFFVYAYVYIRRRTSRESILAAYRDEVNRLVAEIDHATDRDTQLVEDRIAALRKILDEADRRIALMSRDMEKRRASADLYTALGARQGGPSGIPPPGQPPAGTPAGTPAPVRDSPVSPASAAPVSAPPAVGAPAPGQPAAPAALTQRVAELARQGFAAELIAARLGLSLAEVELALAVFRRTGV